MYGSGSKRMGGAGARSGPSSSLMLQQHLVHHYRHLQNVRPVIDSGQVTRARPGAVRGTQQRPWRRQQVPEDQRAPSSGSTATLQLVERILNDVHLPPQYYTGHLLDHSEKSLEMPDDLHELRHDSPEFKPVDGDPPTDDESILDKIDSYLSAVRAEQRRHASRQRFNLARSVAPEPGQPALRPVWRSPLRRSPVRRSPVRGSPARKRQTAAAAGGQRLPRSLAAQRQLQSQILRAHLSPGNKYLPGRQSGEPSSERLRPGAGSVSSSGRWPPQHQLLHCDQLQSRHGSDHHTLVSSSDRVPPLSISPDSDQDHWIAEHSYRTPLTSRSLHVLTAVDRAPSKQSAYDAGRSSGSRARSPEEAAAARAVFGEPAAAGGAAVRGAPSGTFRCDEEQAYVQFLNGVTSDILARGVFTNRTLKQIMMAHVEKHRGRLDTGRMLSELDRLRQELGVPVEPDLDDAQFGYGSSRAPCSAASLPELAVPALCDPALFPGGGSPRSRTARAPAAPTAAPPAGPTLGASGPMVAPPGGRAGNVARLLGDLSLDESITRTVLQCCGDAADPVQDVSVSSDELRRCLADESILRSVT